MAENSARTSPELIKHKTLKRQLEILALFSHGRADLRKASTFNFLHTPFPPIPYTIKRYINH